MVQNKHRVLFDPKSQDCTKSPMAANCCATFSRKLVQQEEDAMVGLKKSTLNLVFPGEYLQFHSASELIINSEGISHTTAKPQGDKRSESKQMWHFGCYSGGKHYIMHRCFSRWPEAYQWKGIRQHRMKAQVLLLKRKQRICIGRFPFQKYCWPTRTNSTASQSNEENAGGLLRQIHSHPRAMRSLSNNLDFNHADLHIY